MQNGKKALNERNSRQKNTIGLQVSFNNQDEGKDADENALADGYISVVPVKLI